MAQERLCSGASLSRMGPPGLQPGLITPTRALTPSAAAGTPRLTPRCVQRVRVGGSARAVQGNCPLQPGLVGSWVLPGDAGQGPSGVLSCVPGSWLGTARALPGDLSCLCASDSPCKWKRGSRCKSPAGMEQSSGALGRSWSVSPRAVRRAWLFSPR